VWSYGPETYKNVLLYPNANEAYLARLIEEEAYKARANKNKILYPTPFRDFVCDGVYGKLIGLDNIQEGATYEVVVTLDTRALAGHHNIAENYDPSQLNWLSSLNYAAATWWD
jgi:hypothetical protein